jgi:hypothetical protein
VSYRPALIGRAPAQFSDLMGDKAIYDALMERIIQLADAPWDAWPTSPGRSRTPAAALLEIDGDRAHA